MAGPLLAAAVSGDAAPVVLIALWGLDIVVGAVLLGVSIRKGRPRWPPDGVTWVFQLRGWLGRPVFVAMTVIGVVGMVQALTRL